VAELGKPMTEPETGDFSADFSERINRFVSGPERLLAFPASLEAHERKLVHELAAANQLGSQSFGAVDSRKVIVYKTDQVPTRCCFEPILFANAGGGRLSWPWQT
jgi:hypothetical protein